ncbi:hypothetical protein EMCRGX_G006218 [Ephydatia muelleri]
MHLWDPSSETEPESETCTVLHPSPKIPANLRARVQQPSPTLRPNLPCLLRWNPDADANARHTGSKDVVNQLALLRALHPTLAALPPPARTVRTTADASARHAGTEKAALSVTTGTAAPCSSSGSSTDSPLISCVSTPARGMVKKIKRAPPLARAQLLQGMPATSRAIALYLPALARRSVAILTTESAPRELNGTMPTSAGAQVVVARNLAPELKHPDIIDAELSKEIAAGRILGPFSEHLLTNLRTSGLGAVQMKNGSSCIWHQ